MKKTLFILSLSIASVSMVSNAQSNAFDAIHIMQASVNIGMTNAYTDAKFPQGQFGFNVGAHYFPFSFISINPSFEIGRLAAGDANSNLASNRQFTNKFVGGNLTLRIFPLKLFLTSEDSYKYFNSLYAGAGAGFISSNVYADPIGNGYLANPNKTGTTYPVEFGINVPVYRNPSGVGQAALNVNYRYYYTNTDEIDGYRPTVSGNLHNDVYSFFTLGLVYQFN